MRKRPSKSPSYLNPMYNLKINDPNVFDDVIERAVRLLRHVKFDTIVFRGFSGAVVGPAVALRLRKPWALIRKEGADTHSCKCIEGIVQGDYVIIDDFVATGTTIRKIVTACGNNRCVGAYFYDYLWADSVSTREDHKGINDAIGGVKVLNWID